MRYVDREQIEKESKYLRESKYKVLHLWSMIVGMICGVIGTHIWQYIEQLF